MFFSARRLAMLATALLWLGVPSAVAQPSAVSPFPRGLSGTLVFQSDARSAANPNGRVKIYTLNLESGAITTLTRDGDWNDEEPRYSPDGSRIAFRSNRTGSYNLYVMDADGGRLTRVTDHPRNDQQPSWHPDGQSLVYASERDRGPGRFDLYRLWLDAGVNERLTNFFEGYAFMPNVSPDGNWAAFVATTFPMDGGYVNQVHVIELATRMTWPFDSTAAGCWPNWSPDGQSIAHVSLLNEPSNIQVVSSFGTDPQPVPGEPSRWHYYPDWSPDSRLLAISTSPEHHAGEDWDLAIVDPSRTMPAQRLTTGAGNDRVPDWKPR
jgi:Tol biopolymer transport system component